MPSAEYMRDYRARKRRDAIEEARGRDDHVRCADELMAALDEVARLKRELASRSPIRVAAGPITMHEAGFGVPRPAPKSGKR